jgi:hypothetical protein
MVLNTRAAECGIALPCQLKLAVRLSVICNRSPPPPPSLEALTCRESGQEEVVAYTYLLDNSQLVVSTHPDQHTSAPVHL